MHDAYDCSRDLKKRWIAFAIAASVAMLEYYGGGHTGSLGLYSDAGHGSVDGVVIGLSIYIEHATHGKPISAGAKLEVVDVLVKGSLLIAIALSVIAHAISRMFFSRPEDIITTPMIQIAAIGAVGNALQFFLNESVSHRGSGHRGLTLHFLSDFWQSVAIIAGGFAIKKTGVQVIDPVISLVIGVWFFLQGIFYIRRSTRLPHAP